MKWDLSEYLDLNTYPSTVFLPAKQNITQFMILTLSFNYEGEGAPINYVVQLKDKPKFKG